MKRLRSCCRILIITSAIGVFMMVCSYSYTSYRDELLRRLQIDVSKNKMIDDLRNDVLLEMETTCKDAYGNFRAPKIAKIENTQQIRRHEVTSYEQTTTQSTTTVTTKVTSTTTSSTELQVVTIEPKGWVYKGERAKRCKVKTFGCFKAVSFRVEREITNFSGFESNNMTDWLCIEFCSNWSTSFVFASLINGNKCECAKSPTYMILLEESENCNVPCLGDQSINCGGQTSSVLFRIVGTCREALRPVHVDIENSSLGCHRKPSNLHLMMESITLNPGSLSGNCILHCERRGLTLAIPSYPKTCFCGHTTESFNLANPTKNKHCSVKKNRFVMVFRTQAEDTRCGNKRFLREGEKKKSIVLSTFPGSGNTWIRHLIESATGIYTGSSYNDGYISQGGYLGEMLKDDKNSSNKVIVTKTHNYAAFTKNMVDAGINIYRDPYDAILSEFNRRKTGKHTKALDEHDFNTAELNNLVAHRTPIRWRFVTEAAIVSTVPALVLAYEDVVKDPVGSAEQMARFVMGDSLQETELKARLLCLRLQTRGNFKRKKKRLSFDPYNNESKEKINKEITRLSKILVNHGYKNITHYLRPLSDD